MERMRKNRAGQRAMSKRRGINGREKEYNRRGERERIEGTEGDRMRGTERRKGRK